MPQQRRSDRWSPLSPASKAVLGFLILVSIVGAALVVMAALRPGGQAHRAVSLLTRDGDAALQSPTVAKALDRAPMDASLVRSLALAQSQAGDAKRATALMRIAGDLSWRDNIAQTWLLDRALLQGRYREAVQHADAMLRREPDLRRTLYPSLVGVVGRPEAANEIVDRLALNPAWRPDFLQTLAATAPPEVTFDVLRRLARTDAPPTVRETTSYVGRLAGLQRYKDISEALRHFAPPAQRNALLRDGDFEAAEGISPFAWRLFGGQGSTISLERSPRGKSGKGLYLFYDGYTTPRLLEQQLLLTPGRYRLSGDQMAARPATTSQLSWKLLCLPGGEPLLSISPTSNGGWGRFSTPFEVPAQGCESQLLFLDPIAGEQRTNIEMWYDNFAIDRERSAP